MNLKDVQQTINEIIEKYGAYGVESFDVYDKDTFNFPKDEIDVEKDNYLISFSERYIAIDF